MKRKYDKPQGSESNQTTQKDVEYQTQKSQKEVYRSSRKGYALTHIGAGLLGAGLYALLMQDCNSNSSQIGENSSDKQETAPSAVYLDEAALDKKFADICDLSKRLDQCEDDLEACLKDNKELSKRPKYCPKQPTQYKCPEVQCPEMPYLRRGK